MDAGLMQYGKVYEMKCIRVIPMMIVMGIIFFLSHQQGESVDLPDILLLDKFLHAGIYFILGLAVSFALPASAWQTGRLKAVTGVVLFCLLYGLSDELHQSFIPGRFPSLYDLVADTIGAGLAALIYSILIRKQQLSRPLSGK